MHCMKADDHSTSASYSISTDHLQSVQRSFHRTSFVSSPEAEKEENGEGIEAVREKLMLDLKAETDKIRNELLKEDDNDRVEAATAAAVLKEGEYGGGLTDVTATAPSKKDGGAKTRPWNLRTRRAGCRAPAAKNCSLARREEGVAGKEKAWQVKEKEREKFALVMMLIGRRPPRQPKKPPCAVRKQLDMLLPGSWLTEIKVDAYKVVELPNDGK